MKPAIVASIVCLLLSAVLASGNLVNQDDGEVVVVSVDSTNLRFSPETITLQEGDSVRFFWSGELLAHNAVESNGLFDSGEASRLSLIHISEPTRPERISYAVFC